MKYTAYRIDRLPEHVLVTRLKDGASLKVPNDRWRFLVRENNGLELKVAAFLFRVASR